MKNGFCNACAAEKAAQKQREQGSEKVKPVRLKKLCKHQNDPSTCIECDQARESGRRPRWER